ncbi:hypothetical protein PGB90_010510 [Kerria lacca]
MRNMNITNKTNSIPRRPEHPLSFFEIIEKCLETFINEKLQNKKQFLTCDTNISKTSNYTFSLNEFLSSLNKPEHAIVKDFFDSFIVNHLNDNLEDPCSIHGDHDIDLERRSNIKKEFRIQNPISDEFKIKSKVIFHPNEMDGRQILKNNKKKRKTATVDVTKFVDFMEIDGTDYKIMFRLNFDQIMEHRKDHINYKRVPKIKVKNNKAYEYREANSNYCGQRQTVKNWLYYT